jgi:histidinol-phosphate aminotransferase
MATSRDGNCVELAAQLRCRISQIYRVPRDWVILLDRADDALRAILRGLNEPVVVFPPSTTASLVPEARLQPNVISVARGVGRYAALDPEVVADLPPASIAIIESPSDPLGSILSPADLVRLARACRFVIVDERYAEFAGATLLPLVPELRNVAVLRSFEHWAGLTAPPCAWAAASPAVADQVALTAAAPNPRAIAAAVATLNHRPTVEATMKLLRDERSRLYRFLRKLSFLTPVPSWAPFVPARIETIPREALLTGLAARGVRIHAPLIDGLEQYVRISAGTRTATQQCMRAMLDLAPELITEILSGQPVRPPSLRAGR